MQSQSAQDTLHITVGQSTLLHGTTPMKRVFVGNPAVLQSFNSSPEEVVLTAKTAGVSTLAIWDTAGQTRLYTVSCDLDPAGLRHAMASVYPDTAIDVQGVEDRLTLTGTVASADISDSMSKLAGLYTKQVANSLRIVPVRAKQVELKLRIVEVDRTRLDQFAVNLGYTGKNVAVSTTTQAFLNPLNVSVDLIKQNLIPNLQDLQQRNILQILAEPTLTSISGQPARFLSGGEFPVPVAQTTTGNTSAITVVFKPFGVKVDFTPNVNPDGSIRLKIAPEVSTLDYTNAVTIAGFTIPALSTRRAETEVEIRDGQSFVLSGLLDRRTTESLGKIPGAASIPLLGQIFRSRNNTHSITELMVLVTATVVDPLHDTATPQQPTNVLPTMTPQDFDQAVQHYPGATRQP